MQSQIPIPLRDLLETKLDSFEKLDLVSALRAAAPSAMRRDELVVGVNSSRDLVAMALSELEMAAVIATDDDGHVHLLPQTDDQALRDLLQLYDRDPTVVAIALAEIGLDRVRSLAAHTFMLRGRR